VGEFTDGALRITIRGQCREGSSVADLTVRAPNATFSDGEISVQARVSEGAERAFYYFGGRVASDGSGGYGAYVFPSQGVGIRRWTAPSRPGAALGQETDQSFIPLEDGWNTVALRFQGTRIWLLVNETPVLMVEDDAFGSGGVQLGVGRTGEIGDTATVTVLFRDFRVRSLVDTGRPATEPTGA
jgi:hypothetical protein